ncbi:MAG: acyl-CoA dehydrogenase family protein [Deltaproteobacteria bacterium]|nr:acyl-CoA dehydrogenase family protein [Deltaproteobacteria bacterium]
MEILQFTEKHHDFRKRLRAFLAEEVIPYVDQWEKEKIEPKQIWRKMGQNGFLCTEIDPEYGGIGGDFLYTVIIGEEMAETNHTGLAVALHSDVVVPYIASFGNAGQKQKYLPGCVSGDIITAVAMTEPDAGSDLAGMTTTAVEEGDEVVINGSKTFISNGIISDLVVIAAMDPAVENPYQAISLYLVEDGTPGFERGRHLEKMGWWSQDTAELFFTKCRIPVANRLGDKGTGFLMLMQKLQQERLVTAVGAVTAAEKILEWTIKYCKSSPDGAKPISKYQANRFTLVEMATEVKIGRVFMEKLVADHMEGKDIIVETSMAKYWTTEMVKRTTDRALDLFGDAGILETCPIARAFRDMRVMSIFAGTNEIMKSIAGKFMGL